MNNQTNADAHALRFTSLVSTVADPFCAVVAEYLAKRLQRPVAFVTAGETGSREALLDARAVDLVWLCGLLYLHKAESGRELTPAVAPCMVGETACDQPVYYADIIVHAESIYQTFSDLRGATWAYNEEASFSGYQAVRTHLAQQQEFTPYFTRMIRSGAHLQSIELVRTGMADCAAIDSTVLQMLSDGTSQLSSELRTVARLGPYPMPLWAFTERCDPTVRQLVVEALLHMHQDDVGRNLLTQWQITRFMAVTPQEYEPLRAARARAQQLAW